MDIERVADAARLVASLPAGARDYFDGLVKDARVEAQRVENRARLRKLSDFEVVGEVVTVACPDPEQALETLLDAGFVRRVVPDLNAAGENRWEVGIRNIVTILHGARHPFEIYDIVEEVRALAAIAGRIPGCTLEKVFEAVFMASGEGWNGEHPGQAEKSDDFAERMKRDLAILTAS
ncbi:hypothetical protein [Methylobacterium sp. WL6]|uniref:hypothetical protein n=1 Tax=Methylobacterium sp. WL6 TaxID=2603901 RepID=UPI0011CC9255|nr:hypothetical protein [Methylobacterium sp. WL6]TXN63214.1 hypothetical protein FV230_20465 [Methylobacterium sp. WL6]